MKNKIFRALVALAAMAVLVASGLITFLVSQDYFNETKKELAQEARYISMGLESGGNDFLNKIAAENGSNVRITLIKPCHEAGNYGSCCRWRGRSRAFFGYA